MLMHVLDPGRRMGTALGMAGEVPRSGFVELRQTKEHRAVGHGNLIAYLSDVWKHRRPDLVVYEAPLSVAAWFQLNLTRKKQGLAPTSSDPVESGLQLESVITGMCIRYGIRFEPVRRQSVLKFVTGKASHGSREAGKKATIEACIRMKLVEPGCKDDDRCDAVANFVFASSEFARKRVGDFHLFA